MNKSLFKNNLEWAKSHEPECIKIIQNNLKNIVDINVSTLYDDINHAVDLVMTIRGEKVQIRVRMPKYQKYSDFTVQISKISDTETEMEKFARGDVDWYLLCWTNSNEEIFKWILIDMHKIIEKDMLKRMGNPQFNTTNGQWFVYINWFKLKEYGCIMSQHNMMPHYNSHKVNINGIDIIQF